MAAIQNVRLQIVENQGAAAALVSFRIVGDAQDVNTHRRYVETVELIGVDSVEGEDQGDEAIPGSRSGESVAFPPQTQERTRLIALQASALDEDGPSSPNTAFSDEDEIRARVTLSRSVSAESETVILHLPVFEGPNAIPA